MAYITFPIADFSRYFFLIIKQKRVVTKICKYLRKMQDFMGSCDKVFNLKAQAVDKMNYLFHCFYDSSQNLWKISEQLLRKYSAVNPANLPLSEMEMYIHWHQQWEGEFPRSRKIFC